MKRIAGIFMLVLLAGCFYAADAGATPSRGSNCASCHLTANAGSDQTVNGGASVTLNGTGSSTYDNQGNIIDRYSWTQTGGAPSVSLSGVSTSRASFTAPVVSTQTTFTFQLAVTDMTTTKTDTCVVTVRPTSTANQPPTANAGADKTAISGRLVTLSGAGSDPDTGDTLTYTWSQIGTPAVSLSGAGTSNASFTAPTVQSATALTFQLAVRDRAGATATDTCTITVSPSGGGTPTGQPPVANAGTDLAVLPGTLNNLSGFYSSDPDDGIASYAWTQTAGPAVTLSNPAASDPVFQAPTSPTTLTFTLTVTDKSGQSDQDTCSVVVLSATGSGTTPTPDPNPNPTPGNQPPVANAGPDQSVRSGSTVRLSAAASTDPNNDIASYRWTQTSGTSVRLSGTTTASASFTAPRVSRTTTLNFQVTVTDRTGLSSTDSVRITVSGSSRDDDDDDDDD